MHAAAAQCHHASTPPHAGDDDSGALQATRAEIWQRLEQICSTEQRLSEHGSHNAMLMAAGHRLLLAKSMQHRLGSPSPLFALAKDLTLSVVSALPRVMSLSGTWLISGAFSHGEAYEYKMVLVEHADGTVTGHGSFGAPHHHPRCEVAGKAAPRTA
jgi:hypothetical protein